MARITHTNEMHRTNSGTEGELDASGIRVVDAGGNFIGTNVESVLAELIALALAGDGYIHTQLAALTVWPIPHNLGRYPSVTVVDSGKNVVHGNVEYVDANNITLTFSAAFSGYAYLN